LSVEEKEFLPRYHWGRKLTQLAPKIETSWKTKFAHMMMNTLISSISPHL
jgi:hypothetical protein